MYDAVVVGARCAGASIAMLLARQGHRILMIDKDSRGTDMTHSTHFVQPIAVSKLRKWGLLPALEAVCPAFDSYSLDFGVAHVIGMPPAVDGDSRAFCPRRDVLDPILVEGAELAGVEYQPDIKVVGLLRNSEGIAGVTTVNAADIHRDIRSRIVIGADGPGSTVAKEVDAEQYHEAPAQQATVWGYWSGVSSTALEMYFSPGRAVYSGPTSGNETLVGVNWVIDDFKENRSDIETNYFEVVEKLAPALAAQMKVGRLSTRLRIGSTRNFLRIPYGPGWALVGDAGHKKDPCTAQGITDAFIDADDCATVIDNGLRNPDQLMTGLAEWHRKRDARLIPFHEMTIQMAKFRAPDDDEIALYRALEGNREATTQFLGLITGATNPNEFFAPLNIRSIINGYAP